MGICSIGLESLLWLRMVLYIMFVQYCYSPNSTSTQLNYVWFDTKLGLQTTHHHPTKLNLGLLIPSLFLPNSSSTSTPSIRPLHTSSYLLRNRRHSNPAASSSTTAVKSNVSGTTISNCKLKLPHKLQQFVCLEEMVVPN